MADPENSALGDARKRARRRLVGAVVLALAAAVVLPIFLESDPKPLGPDVQIQIPAVDDAKFQNRLTPAGASKAPANDKMTQTSVSQPVKAPRERSDSEGVPARSNASTVSESPQTTTDPSAPATVPPPGATSAPDPVPVLAPAPAVTQGEFVVQIGAFVGLAVANELAAKAREQGFSVFLEPVTTKSGRVQRVRVGPFATHGEADAVAGKLKAAGFTAVTRPR